MVGAEGREPSASHAHNPRLRSRTPDDGFALLLGTVLEQLQRVAVDVGGTLRTPSYSGG